MVTKRWAIRMLFLWRWRLGYWDWHAFWVAFTLPAKRRKHAP